MKNGGNANMKITALSIGLVVSTTLVGCMSPPRPLSQRNSQLTQGNVQMNLKVGETTKAQVLEHFGSPNITTRDGTGREVWSYQRTAQVAQSSSQSGYWTIVFAGQSSNASGFESSSRMMTLIIKFDSNDIVADFKSRTSDF
jgi:outer membrane protein assembly factor BamE (lipoprotein component of BamABCDE complex)